MHSGFMTPCRISFKSRSNRLAKVLGRSIVEPLLILRSLETTFASGTNGNPKFRNEARSFVDRHYADHEIS